MELVRWLHLQLKHLYFPLKPPEPGPRQQEPCRVSSVSRSTTGTQAASALCLASMWYTCVRWSSAVTTITTIATYGGVFFKGPTPHQNPVRQNATGMWNALRAHLKIKKKICVWLQSWRRSPLTKHPAYTSWMSENWMRSWISHKSFYKAVQWKSFAARNFNGAELFRFFPLFSHTSIYIASEVSLIVW